MQGHYRHTYIYIRVTGEGFYGQQTLNERLNKKCYSIFRPSLFIWYGLVRNLWFGCYGMGLFSIFLLV